jgi:RNA polymerase sigma factor (TIGR02999 family)
MPEGPETVTQLLIAWSDGDRQALETLIPIVYAELHQSARRHLAREGSGHLLQPTALVNEAYLKLIDQQVRWQNRAQFFGVAAQLMRRILLDQARNRKRLKRGGAGQAVTISLDRLEAGTSALDRIDMIALDRSLTRLTDIDPERGRLVELRFFGGLTIEETAETMELSPATVKRMWGSARAWLYRDLTKGAEA